MITSLRRAVAFAAVCIGSGIVNPALAQEVRLTPREIGQIVDVVLDSLLDPSQSVSRVPVSKRGVFLDHEATMSSFGYPGPVTSPLAALNLRRAVKPGARSQLSDCDQFGTQKCTQLGWGVFVWIEQLAVTTSTAFIRAWFVWADRDPAEFQDGVAPQGFAVRVGFATEVYLARARDGTWIFVRRGRTTVA